MSNSNTARNSPVKLLDSAPAAAEPAAAACIRGCHGGARYQHGREA